MIIINFKNYLHKEEVLKRVKLIEKYIPRAMIALSSIDIGYINEKTKLKIYAQHFDITETQNRATGFTNIDSLKSYSVVGSLINHSEHPISLKQIVRRINESKKEKIISVVCVPTLNFAEKIISLSIKPDIIAFEDKNLIATGRSITQYREDNVKKFVKMLKKTRIVPLCGAGISSTEDVQTAYWLGCDGVLIASAIANVSTKKAEKMLKEMSNTKINFSN